MASVKIASHNYFAFENSLSNPTRTDSFSSYLNFIRENFLPELENSAPERLSCQISLNRKKDTNREIDVFDAEKYFSEKLEDDRLQVTKISPKKPAASRETRPRAHKPPSAAGSTCSDTSSNMSQRRLLRDYSSRLSRRQGADASGRSKFLGVFPCPCAGKNAVSVVQEAHPRGSLQMDHKRDWKHTSRGGDGRTMREPRMHGVRDELKDHIYAAFPPNRNNAVKPIEMELIEEEKVGVPKPVLQKDDLLSSSAKMIMIGREECGGGSFHGRRVVNEVEDEDIDVVSETSSDLFEIETISMNSHPFFSRQGTESTTGYEPSEASIEWSVATAAAAADFPPASEFHGRGLSTNRASKASRLQRPGLLMGCASNKAVDVSANSYRKPERASFDVESQFCPEGSAAAVARYRAESCGVMNVDASRSTGRVVAPAAFASGRSIGTRVRLHSGDA